MVFENVAEIDRRYVTVFQIHMKTVGAQIEIINRMIKYISFNMGESVIPDKKNRNIEYDSVLKFDEQYQKKLKKFSKIMISLSKMSFGAQKVLSLKEDSENDKFIDVICLQYGFDVQTAQTMKTLYENLEENFGENAPQMFFALMASISYGSVEGTQNAILWGIIGTIPPTGLYGYKIFEPYGITEEEYSHMKTQIQIQHILCEMAKDSTIADIAANRALIDYLNEKTENALGASFKELPEEIRQEFYNSYLGYCNTTDFTHMSATMATILNDTDMKELGNFAGVYNGIYSVDGNAGYVGDVYGTNGNIPSMGNADYMADLDAVNIANRIENGNDMFDAISEHYTELENGQTNRAREFKYYMGEGYEDIGWTELESEYQKTEEDMKQIIRYSHIEVLTQEIVDVFIQKVYVYKDKRGR